METELPREATSNSTKGLFVHACDQEDGTPETWQGIKVCREELEAEAQRLMSMKKPATSIRRSFIVHPQSKAKTITPGIQATIEVIMPGEVIALKPKNSSSVGLSIAGIVTARIDDADLTIDKHDVWSVPNMATVIYSNESSEPHVRLAFSDAPILEFLHAIYLSDGEVATATPGDRQRDPMADFIHRLPTGGSAVKTYHAFADPEVVEQSARLWKWAEVKDFLNKMEKHTPDLRAATIGLLWNPATGRTNGSTNTLTACMNGGIDPTWTGTKWNMARPHRHNVTALNYGIAGQSRTLVEGKEILWGPGDLVLSAPAWATHSNGRMDREVYTFTIHNNALLSALNANMMQEYLDKPAVHLGARPR